MIDGEQQPLYRRTWDGKIFVAGIPGQAYTLRVRNLTPGRVEVLNAVDGQNTLEDEPGDMGRNRGMVFSGLSSGGFSGWRISDDETREFIFGEPEKSVAVQAAGSTSNVGVIGFAVYREVPLYSERAFRGGTLGEIATRGMATKGGPDTFGGNLGTGIGQIQEDRVGRTTFQRLGAPELVVIGYATNDWLHERGIIVPAEPNPFPGAKTGYANYKPEV